MAEEPPQRRFARLFVNRGFQLRMLRRAVAPLLALSLSIGAVLVVYTPPGGVYSGTELRTFGLLGLTSLFLFGTGGIMWSLWLFSSRVAGPMLQLQRTLQEVASGNLVVRMRVRQRDELQEHTAHLNRTIESLQGRVVRITQFCEFARRSVQEMRAGDPENPNLARILDLVTSIEESVGDFHVR